MLSLLARVRHTNTLVIADRGFPIWPQIETVDISLVDGVPRVLDVLAAIRANYVIGHAWMAEEFHGANNARTRKEFAAACAGDPAHLRAAHRLQEARSARDRAHPHRGHDPVRQHDSGVSLKSSVRDHTAEAISLPMSRRAHEMNADWSPFLRYFA
jgi:hypothetical protein